VTGVRFGVMLNHQYGRDEDLLQRIEEGVATTELIRDLGYDMLLSHHHFLANLQTPQALPVLAHLVPYSGSMRLGIGVYIATLEHPVALAEHFATLDQISGGRLIWGVGAGYRQDEFDSFGIEHRTRQSRFYEAIDLVTKLWSGEPVTHQGRHFRVEGQTISVVPRQRPRPPIWIGANGPKTIVRAAAHGDAWLASPHLKVNWCNGNLAAFKAEQERLGIDASAGEHPIVRELYIADSDARAREEVEPYIGTEYAAFSDYDPIYRDHYEEMWEKSFLIGSPETVRARVEQLAEGGWNAFVFRTDWAGMPVEMVRRTIVRFAQEVMPELACVRSV
jgi:alkanesulfonate monooxygenase SsuD/methylene tetrahydromethanopterin reductase-like flavin-dependent oxidoreductase (luciferase family)